MRLPAAWVEPAAAALIVLGANGVVILGADPSEAEGEWAEVPAPEPPGVRAYFPCDDLLGQRLQLFQARLAEAAGDDPAPDVEISLRPVEADWAEAWKAHYRPVHVGRIAVVPSWEEYTAGPGEAIVRLDPGLAFGAGTHPTTRQALRLLQEELRPGESVLDIGTGSGVLAIAAALLGAERVLARDVDPVAVETAEGNVVRNGLSGRITVERGDLAAGVADRYDLTLANLVAPLILALMPALPGIMATGGRIVAAGLIRGRAAEVAAAAVRIGLKVKREIREGEWVAMVLGKSQ